MKHRHPVGYTFLGFHFNSLVDNGKSLDLRETHQQIRDRNLFNWLSEKFGDEIDLSLYSEDDLNEILDFFGSISEVTDERRKMGITKNGLCLLVAYCLEAAKRKEESLR